MPAVLAPHTVAESYRTAQAKIAAETAAQVAIAFRTLLNPADLDGTFGIYTSAAAQIINAARQRAAGLGGAFYLAHRNASGVLAALPEIAWAGNMDPARLTTSLLVTGPVSVKRSLRMGATLRQALATAEVKTSGATYRHTANAGRGTIHGTVYRDEEALGWARVSDGRPCVFCALLVSRGAVYKSATTAGLTGEGEKYHDHCGCFVVPLYTRDDPIPGLGPELAQLWEDAQKGRKRGQSAMEAFRDAYNAKYPQGTNPSERIARAQLAAHRAEAERNRKAVEPPAPVAPVIPAWRKEFDEIAARFPSDRTDLGYVTLTQTELDARKDAATADLHREVAELDAKNDAANALANDLYELKWRYATKVSPALAKKARALGFSAAGGPQKTIDRIRDWQNNELYQARSDLTYKIFTIEARFRNPRSADLDERGALGQRVDGALATTLDAGRVIEAEIDRRMTERGVSLAALEARVNTTAKTFDDAFARRLAVNDELAATARSVVGKAERDWTPADADYFKRLLDGLRQNHPDYVAAQAAEYQARLAMRAAKDTLDGTFRKAYAETAHEVLSDVRSMGGQTLTFKPLTGPDAARLTTAMRYAESRYPSEWLARSEKAEGNWDLSIERRGYNLPGASKIVLSTSNPSVVTGGDLDRVATHELGHSMEQALSELRALEWALHYKRSTEVGPDGIRRYVAEEEIYAGSGEKGIRDDWMEFYTGKTYGSEPKSFYEVFTTGVESLFDGSPYFDRRGVHGDVEFRRFILGVLSVL